MITHIGTAHSAGTHSHRSVRVLYAMLVAVAAFSPFPGYDFVLILLCSIALLFVMFESTQYRFGATDLLPVPVLSVMLLSLGWSQLPEATLRLSITFILIALVVSRLSRTLTAGDFIDTVAAGLRISLSGSVLFALVRPDVGLVAGEYATGALQGLYNHRNFLAFSCVVLIACRFPSLLLERIRAIRIFDFILGVGCLIAAQSQTSLIAAGSVVVLVVMGCFIRRYSPATRLTVWACILCGTGAVVQTLVTNFTSVTQGLGRDTTLTGRTDVWAAVLEEIPRHLWFGAGWGAVWQEGLPTSSRMWDDAGFKMFHAHDGFLDLILQVGVVGLVLYLLVIMVTIFRALVLDIGEPPYVAMWVGAVAAALLVSSLAESPFSTPFGWVIAMSIYFVSVTRESKRTESDPGQVGDTYPRMGT